jgi:membrane carboxypeptidase/penicillin-binding protein
LALGAFPVQPLEMAGVFATLANQGRLVKPFAILKVSDARGNVLIDNTGHLSEKQVIPQAEAYVMTNLLESVFAPGGTAHSVQGMLARPSAGKTGTTDTDAWLSGYTPDLAATVWIGYDDNKPLSATEEHLSKTIWASFIAKALEETPAGLFKMPAGVVSRYVPNAASLFTHDCSQASLEVFIAGTEPNQRCAPPAQSSPLTDTARPSTQNRGWWNRITDWLR